MTSDREYLGAPAVVVLPDEIDLLNAQSVGARLSAAIGSGASVIIADLSMTTFCDCAGARTLLLAHRTASASNAELRLVIRSRAILHILALINADHVLPVYPDLGAAAAVRPTPAPRAPAVLGLASGPSRRCLAQGRTPGRRPSPAGTARSAPGSMTTAAVHDDAGRPRGSGGSPHSGALAEEIALREVGLDGGHHLG